MGRLKTVCLLALLAIFCIPHTAYATEPTETAESAEPGMGEVYIEAHYSSNIVPQPGDEFELVYMAAGGTDTATITLDASNYVEDTGVFELPENAYEIISISYLGSNADIKVEGYGVRRDFVSNKDDGSFIYISIGKTANIALSQNYEGALFVDPDNSINESKVEERNSELATAEPTEATETASKAETEAGLTESPEVVPNNTSTEEVVVEHYKDAEKTENGSPLMRIVKKLVVIIVLMLFVGLAGLIALKVTKKI